MTYILGAFNHGKGSMPADPFQSPHGTQPDISEGQRQFLRDFAEAYRVEVEADGPGVRIVPSEASAAPGWKQAFPGPASFAGPPRWLTIRFHQPPGPPETATTETSATDRKAFESGAEPIMAVVRSDLVDDGEPVWSVMVTDRVSPGKPTMLLLDERRPEEG